MKKNNYRKNKLNKIIKNEHDYKFVFNQFMQYDELKKSMAILTILIED